MKGIAISLLIVLLSVIGCTPNSGNPTNEECDITQAAKTEIQPEMYPQDTVFTQEQLDSIKEEVSRRWDLLPDGLLEANLTGCGSNEHFVEVRLICNTPEIRQLFREQVMDSPAIRFSGTEHPVRDETVAPFDTLNLTLYPEYTVYADTATFVSFLLINSNNKDVLCGEGYFITYEGKDGNWYQLPINNNVIDIGHIVYSGTYKRFDACLYPKAHKNQPGRYRFFYNVSLDRGKDVLLMTEFRLTDKYEEALHAPKTKWKEIYANLIPQDPDEDGVYSVAEEMPEFPGGIPALMEFVQKNLRHYLAESPTRIIIAFVVDKEGNVIDPILMRTTVPEHSELVKEALRVVQLMPRWKPGRIHGEVVKVQYIMPIDFKPAKEKERKK